MTVDPSESRNPGKRRTWWPFPSWLVRIAGPNRPPRRQAASARTSFSSRLSGGAPSEPGPISLWPKRNGNDKALRRNFCGKPFLLPRPTRDTQDVLLRHTDNELGFGTERQHNQNTPAPGT